LGHNISYEGEKELNIKAANFIKVVGIINQIFKPSLVSRHTRIRIYMTLARPVLSYGNEAWTIRRTDDHGFWGGFEGSHMGKAIPTKSHTES
jgi:hypothetical protein